MVVTVGLRNPAGRAAPRAARARGRRDVGGDPRVDHADRARATGCCPRSRRSRTRAPATKKRAKPKRTRPMPRDAGRCRCRSAVSHPAEARRPQPRVLDRRRARRAALLALPGLRLLHPSAAADLPDRATRRTWRSKRCRGGRRSRRTRSTTRTGCPGPELPYVVAIVEIVEQPSVRLTTNLVNCPPDEIEIGMPVRVTFEHHPIPTATCTSRCSSPTGASDMDANEIIERRACITRRRPVRHRPAAVPRSAGAHARRLPRRDRPTPGLTTADIDGLSTYPGPMGTPAGLQRRGRVRGDGRAAARTAAGTAAGSRRRASSARSINACLAVASGLANHVLCFRSVCEGSRAGRQGPLRRSCPAVAEAEAAFKASGFMEWNLPFSAPSAAIWIAMFAQRHFHKYGTTQEQMAWIALNARRNAELNPKAIYRDPMSMDDYMNVAHDHDAVLPLRLRRAVRRRDRGDRVAARPGEGPAQPAAARRGGRRRASTVVRRGTSSTTCRRCRTATRARSCGSAPT